jgi:hypothetical protein
LKKTFFMRISKGAPTPIYILIKIFTSYKAEGQRKGDVTKVYSAKQ